MSRDMFPCYRGVCSAERRRRCEEEKESPPDHTRFCQRDCVRCPLEGAYIVLLWDVLFSDCLFQFLVSVPSEYLLVLVRPVQHRWQQALSFLRAPGTVYVDGARQVIWPFLRGDSFKYTLPPFLSPSRSMPCSSSSHFSSSLSRHLGSFSTSPHSPGRSKAQMDRLSFQPGFHLKPTLISRMLA